MKFIIMYILLNAIKKKTERSNGNKLFTQNYLKILPIKLLKIKKDKILEINVLLILLEMIIFYILKNSKTK